MKKRDSWHRNWWRQEMWAYEPTIIIPGKHAHRQLCQVQDDCGWQEQWLQRAGESFNLWLVLDDSLHRRNQLTHWTLNRGLPKHTFSLVLSFWFLSLSLALFNNTNNQREQTSTGDNPNIILHQRTAARVGEVSTSLLFPPNKCRETCGMWPALSAPTATRAFTTQVQCPCVSLCDCLLVSSFFVILFFFHCAFSVGSWLRLNQWGFYNKNEV